MKQATKTDLDSDFFPKNCENRRNSTYLRAREGANKTVINIPSMRFSRMHWSLIGEIVVSPSPIDSNHRTPRGFCVRFVCVKMRCNRTKFMVGFPV